MTTGGVDKDWSSWIYDPCANTWADHPPALKSPPISQYYALALDSTLQEAVLFGGFDAQHATRDDTWIYDLAANTWSTVVAGVPDGPQARIDAAMVYNPETKTVIMFGGRSAEGKAADVPTDTWEYLPADSKG